MAPRSCLLLLVASMATTAVVTVFTDAEGPPQVTNCSIESHRHNWSAVLSCHVSHASSTAGVYHARLLELRHAAFLSHHDWHLGPYFLRNIIDDSDPRSVSNLKIHDQQSFPDLVPSYVNATDGQVHYRGRLQYTWRLASADRGFHHATVIVCPSPNPYHCLLPSPWLTDLPKISRPGALTHNCSQLSHVAERVATTCTCTAHSLGSPPGRLLWLLDGAVWLTGGYGVMRLSLTTQALTRERTGRQATCRLDWIDSQDVYLPVSLAYGPDTVDLLVHQHTDGRLLTVECHVTGMTPVTPDMVQWEGPCQGQRGFSCLLDRQRMDVDGERVTCRVTNAANDGHSAAASKVLDTDRTMAPTQCGSDGLKWTSVRGEVAFDVVVVIALLVVTGLLWIYRRAASQGPVSGEASAEPEGEQQSENGSRDDAS